jgi:hypothetical protein
MKKLKIESNLLNILRAAPPIAIPKSDTQPYLYLLMLSRGMVYESELREIFVGNQRSPLQALQGDDYHNWLINPIYDDNGKIIGRELDPRHFSGDPLLDNLARAQRRKDLKKISHKVAKQGRKREPRAEEELREAEINYTEQFGNAANDEEKTTAANDEE